MRQFGWIGAILFLLCSTSFSATTTFDANAVIQDGDVYDIVVVTGDNTTINVTGGEINHLFLLDSCTVNITGGTFMKSSNQTERADIACFDNTSLNIFGSQSLDWSIEINAFDSSKVTVNQTDTKVSIFAFHQSRIELIGGTIGVMEIFHSSIVNVSGLLGLGFSPEIHETSTLNIFVDLPSAYITGDGSSIINVYGGSFGHLVPSENCTTNLYGGEISNGIFVSCRNYETYPVSHNPVTNIFGSNLMAVPYGGTMDYGEVSGVWADQSPFSIPLESVCSFSSIILHEGGAPPPICGANLLGDINLDCQVNLLDFAYIQSEWLDCGWSPVEACNP